MSPAELRALGVFVLLAMAYAAWDDRRWLGWIRRLIGPTQVVGTWAPNPSKDCNHGHDAGWWS